MKRAKRTGAFTLIEMTVVVAVLSLFAALIVPNLVNMREAQSRRAFVTGMERVARDAQNRAMQDRRTVTLRYVEAENELQAILAADPQNPTDEETVVDRLVAPEDVRVERFLLDGQESNAGEWELRFYGDGQADSGGFEVELDGLRRSVEIRRSGEIRLIEGELPLATDDRWPAGELMQRV